jgi:hypothetical protein
LNPRAGPDFLGAVLEDEAGIRVTGDVEVHLRAPDWFAHRHHLDANYNGVVLHVVLNPTGQRGTSLKSGMAAPVVALPVSAAVTDSDVEASHCENANASAVQADGLGEMLDRAGDARFHARSSGFAMEMKDTAPGEVLYRALMEAAGFASNRRPFRRLAVAVPMSYLMRLRGEPISTRETAIRAALLAASGLMSKVEDESEGQMLSRIRRHLPTTGTVSAREWVLFRLRPANHPLRRISGMAELLCRYLDEGLVEGIAARVFDARSPAEVTSALAAPPNIGTQRARQFAVDVALPFLHAYAAVRRESGLGSKAISLYERYPKLPENEITREMRRMLGITAGDRTVNTARRQQGLIGLYRERQSQMRQGAGTGVDSLSDSPNPEI